MATYPKITSAQGGATTSNNSGAGQLQPFTIANYDGIILGGVLLTLLPELFRHGAGPVQMAVFGKILLDPEALRMLLFGLALVLVMLYRPAGLWPSTTRRRELTAESTTDVMKEGE